MNLKRTRSISNKKDNYIEENIEENEPVDPYDRKMENDRDWMIKYWTET